MVVLKGDNGVGLSLERDRREGRCGRLVISITDKGKTTPVGSVKEKIIHVGLRTFLTTPFGEGHPIGEEDGVPVWSVIGLSSPYARLLAKPLDQGVELFFEDNQGKGFGPTLVLAARTRAAW
jgi:hypothetical protein